MCGLQDLNRNKYNFFHRICVAALWCSEYLLIFCTHVYLYLLSSSGVQWGLYQGIYSGGGLGDCMSPVTQLFLTTPLSSKLCRISKSFTPCNPNFWGVLGYVQESLSNVESESECAIGCGHNTECVAAERQNQEVYPMQVVTQQTPLWHRII